MAMMALTVRVMPLSPDTNLNELQEEIKKIIAEKGKLVKEERQDVAFGLKAILITLAMQEENSTDELLDKIRDIENVSSAEIIDMRRAFG